jgi:hypothetical protein
MISSGKSWMVDMLGDLFQESRIATPMAMIQVTTSNSISSPLGFDFQITLSQYMRYKLIQVNGLWTRLNLNALDRARFRVSRVTVVVEEEIKQDTETPGKETTGTDTDETSDMESERRDR